MQQFYCFTLFDGQSPYDMTSGVSRVVCHSQRWLTQRRVLRSSLRRWQRLWRSDSLQMRPGKPGEIWCFFFFMRCHLTNIRFMAKKMVLDVLDNLYWNQWPIDNYWSLHLKLFTSRCHQTWLAGNMIDPNEVIFQPRLMTPEAMRDFCWYFILLLAPSKQGFNMI